MFCRTVDDTELRDEFRNTNFSLPNLHNLAVSHGIDHIVQPFLEFAYLHGSHATECTSACVKTRLDIIHI
jgi:hypothetical protein